MRIALRSGTFSDNLYPGPVKRHVTTRAASPSDHGTPVAGVGTECDREPRLTNTSFSGQRVHTSSSGAAFFQRICQNFQFRIAAYQPLQQRCPSSQLLAPSYTLTAVWPAPFPLSPLAPHDRLSPAKEITTVGPKLLCSCCPRSDERFRERVLARSQNLISLLLRLAHPDPWSIVFRVGCKRRNRKEEPRPTTANSRQQDSNPLTSG